MATTIGRAAFAAACATLAFGTPVRAGAGSLAPAKASDVVVGVIAPSSPACPNGIANMFQMALQLAADGIVVKPPAVLCASLPNSVAESGSIVVNGFLAKDR